MVIRAEQGRLDEAARLLKQASAGFEEALGRSSLNFQLLRISDAELLMLRHDYEGAAKELGEVDQETASGLPKALWIRVRALAPLGSALMKLKRPEEARQVLEQALALVKQDPGEGSPLGRQVKGLLAKVGMVNGH